jgi:putative flippase GtrA
VRRAELLRFIGYAFVGAGGTAVQYAVLASLVFVKLSGAVTASCIGAIAGAVVNYLLNYRFTFKASGSHRRAAPRFAIVAGAAIALNGALMAALTHHLSVAWLPAQAATTLCVLLFTYAASACWTFRAERV